MPRYVINRRFEVGEDEMPEIGRRSRQIIEEDRAHALRSSTGAYHPVLRSAGVQLEGGVKRGATAPERVRDKLHAGSGQAEPGSEKAFWTSRTTTNTSPGSAL